MKQKLILICGVVCLSIFTGCKKEEVPPVPAPPDITQRTVLMYLFQDTNLSEELTDNINEIEQGWDSTIDGTMLVYVDASTRMTQFDGKPVLLEITHDTTNIIVSKIVKVYPDADATNTEVFSQVQDDVIDMYPSESYGLILSGHGDGFFVRNPDPNSKGLSGSDRWSNNFLDVDVIADNVPVHYDFIIFDACLMGETSTLYQLRNATDFVVASVELSPGNGFAYRSDLKALFTQPKADLSTFTRSTANYYKNTPQGRLSIDTASYTTIGVYRMAAMEKLAAVTNEAITKLSLSYDQLRQSFETIRANPEYGVSNSMYYPQDTKYSKNPMYYDMWLLKQLLDNMEEDALVKELDNAIFDVVMQRHFALSDIFEDDNPKYTKKTANMSFFIPNKLDQDISGQSDAFYNRFEWSAASGFTDQWE